MKRLSLSLLAIGMAATVGTASAQSINLSGAPQVAPAYDQRGYNGHDNGQYGNAQYDYARVISVVRVPNGGYANSSYGSQGQRCYTRNDGYVDRYGNSYPNGYNNGYYGNGYGGSQTGRTVATVVGGVVGAVLGSQVGGSIYDQSRRQRQVGQVTVCDPVPTDGRYSNASYGNAGYDAYDVTYEYNGRRYTSRMNQHPGDRVRVRVNVTPE